MIRLAGVLPTKQAFIVIGLSHDDVLGLLADEQLRIDTAAPFPEGLDVERGPVIGVVIGTDEEDLSRRLAALGVEITDPAPGSATSSG